MLLQEVLMVGGHRVPGVLLLACIWATGLRTIGNATINAKISTGRSRPETQSDSHGQCTTRPDRTIKRKAPWMPNANPPVRSNAQH